MATVLVEKPKVEQQLAVQTSLWNDLADVLGYPQSWMANVQGALAAQGKTFQLRTLAE